ncbi:hypothetical protein HDU81_007383 [Chytriomyces hyalinus]|nr:hypothetical protein HDU81_007383 [Chytriomyces hyalinus]
MSAIKEGASLLCDTVSHLMPMSEENDRKEGDKYVLRPLDIVLFEGDASDPVSAFIKSVTLHGVIPNLKSPFHRVWTHSGILVDKTVLPLPCLEDGKIYIYESGFSGEIYPVFLYSRVLPVDHVVAKRGHHLGPQIRDFSAVVAEGTMTVAVAPLTDDFRQLALEKLKQNLPIPNILPAIAAAEDKVYKQLQSFKRSVSTIIPQAAVNVKPEIFCSELVAIIFQRMGLPSFTETNADQMTPVSLEACPEFGGRIYYPKEFRTKED